MRNLSAVLEEGGSGLQFVNKANIYLVEPDDFAAVNETYVSFFNGEGPIPVRNFFKRAGVSYILYILLIYRGKFKGSDMCFRKSVAVGDGC